MHVQMPCWRRCTGTGPGTCHVKEAIGQFRKIVNGTYWSEFQIGPIMTKWVSFESYNIKVYETKKKKTQYTVYLSNGMAPKLHW